MRLIQLQDLQVVFPGRVLFRDVTWSIFRGERTGIVGPNGAGKTTMLKIILGNDAATSGEVMRSKGLTTGYLPQQGIVHKGHELFAEAWSGLPDLPKLQREITEVHQQLERTPDDHDVVEQLGALEHRWQELEGYSAEAKVARVLGGLGFATADFKRPCEEFSGGWQMRIALAKLLLFDPDILLLDEPTNHLDLPALMWLEEFLEKYDGALVLVSHDRSFLDRVVNRIGELTSGRFTLYHGNYSSYELEREQRYAQVEAAADKQAEERERIERFVERFRFKASKAKQVQSRVKMLEKFEEIEIRKSTRRVNFRFPEAPPSGKFTLEIRDVSKSYGDLEVFRSMNFTFTRGEKVALVGRNGAGKSTLCRLIVGVDKVTTGSVKLGHNVNVDYFAQEADFHLHENATVLSEMEAEGASFSPEWLRSLLGAFLFSGDDAFKPITVLSGGEKARLALAKMLLHPSNFLILDEPTNHLDMSSQEVLLDALKSYQGTLLVVSHDRYFLDRLVDRVLEISDGELRDYPGNLSDYLARNTQGGANRATGDDESDRIPVSSRSISSKKSKDQRRQEAEVRQRFSKQIRDLKEEVETLQGKIGAGENRKRKLEELLGQQDVIRNTETFKKHLTEYDALRRDIPLWEERWAAASVELEQIESERELAVATQLSSGRV